MPQLMQWLCSAGVDINSGCNPSDGSRQVGPCVASTQTAPLANITSNILPENLVR